MHRPRLQLDRGVSRPSVADVLLLSGLALPLAAARDAPVAAVAAAVVLVTAGVGALRFAPLLSLQAVGGLSLLCLTVGFGALDLWPVPASVVIAYLAGRRAVGRRPATVVFSATALVGLVLALALGDGWSWLSLLLLETTAVLSWAAGRYRRLRGDLTDEGWRHAERLERESRTAAQEARLRERTRIAQDMHDSLGHRLSLIALQAGALEVSPGLDGPSHAAAEQLRRTATEATHQLHEIIGLLHEESGADPEPIVRSIEELVAEARASGAPVLLHREGEPSALDSRVDRAAYRVVEESLTNAIKHAAGRPITVRMTYRPDDVEVSVVNELPLRRPPVDGMNRIGSGRGLLGLHERVRLAGGVLRAGPRDGEFWVVARLPRTLAAVGGPPSDQVPGWPAPGGEVHGARRRLLWDLRFTVLLPLALVALLALTFLGLRTYTTYTIGLNSADYARIRIDQSRAAAEPYLPSSHLSETLPVVPEPAAPPGSECEYFRTSTNPFDLSDDLYRLCWRDDRLVSKNVLRRKF
ncbi:sensor histidine kinase [Cryptosporangium sp. NPDC048952]|uniref:sensor histidine kinase n=1 Tax=Cryptosporangium sp. NPDC048952 TaxID=3363961 RepID=UPI0037124B41